MSKGATFKSEATLARDSRTGLPVRQVTSHASIHHHPFFYIPAYDDQMRWLFFVSHQSGTPQIFAEERSTGILRQLTDRADLNE